MAQKERIQNESHEAEKPEDKAAQEAEKLLEPLPAFDSADQAKLIATFIREHKGSLRPPPPLFHSQ